MKTIKFNRCVYSDETIKQSMNAFCNHVKTKVKFESNYAIMFFSNFKYDENQTIKEFENYMIGVENSLQ